MSCRSCLRENQPVVARGLCRACYQRWRKTGSTEYQKWGKVVLCSIEGCSKKHKSHGLCGMHLLRLKKHGDVNNSGPDCWGAKTKHPLYNAWANLRRHKANHPMVERWDDFLQFVMDIGHRPTPKHKLFIADDKKPIGPDNFIWKVSVTEMVDGEDRKTYLARMQRVYRAVRKEDFAGYDLKRHYGISKVRYLEMVESQNGLCAICGNEETATKRGSTEKRSLAVDHCHKGGHVRGLLCSKCNTGLGSFRDNPSLLSAAIAYLAKHALPAPPE